MHPCPGDALAAPVVATSLPSLQQHSRPSAEATQHVYWVMDLLMRVAEPSAAPAHARDSETLVSPLFYARAAVSSAPPAAACTAASCSSNTFISPEHPPEIQNEKRAALRDWEQGLLCEIKRVPNSVLSHSATNSCLPSAAVTGCSAGPGASRSLCSTQRNERGEARAWICAVKPRRFPQCSGFISLPVSVVQGICS